MNTIVFHTHRFPTDPEGDLVYCNGQPGSAAAQWVRSILADQGITTQEHLQEDYGWGFWLDDPLKVWVAVSYAGGEQDNVDDLPEWHISVVHEISIFTPRQIFHRKPGRALADRIYAIIKSAISDHPEMIIDDTLTD